MYIATRECKITLLANVLREMPEHVNVRVPSCRLDLIRDNAFAAGKRNCSGKNNSLLGILDLVRGAFRTEHFELSPGVQI